MPVDHQSLDFHRIQIGNFHNGAQPCYEGNSKNRKEKCDETLQTKHESTI